jgi:hypothetical protein
MEFEELVELSHATEDDSITPETRRTCGSYQAQSFGGHAGHDSSTGIISD